MKEVLRVEIVTVVDRGSPFYTPSAFYAHCPACQPEDDMDHLYVFRAEKRIAAVIDGCDHIAARHVGTGAKLALV